MLAMTAVHISPDIFWHRIRSNSLWTGHVTRMEDERISKKVCNGKFHSTRPVGKPRNLWEGVVQRGTSQIIGVWGGRR